MIFNDIAIVLRLAVGEEIPEMKYNPKRAKWSSPSVDIKSDRTGNEVKFVIWPEFEFNNRPLWYSVRADVIQISLKRKGSEDCRGQQVVSFAIFACLCGLECVPCGLVKKGVWRKSSVTLDSTSGASR